MSSQIILSQDASLRGQDLSLAYSLAKSEPNPAVFHMFKKKEALDTMAKSLLKHKIQNLTGKTSLDIEEEMGYPSTRDGGGVPIDVLRRLAHFLILQASGQLENNCVPNPIPVAQELSQPAFRKATRGKALDKDSTLIMDSPVPRASRKSVCPASPSLVVNGTPKKSARRSCDPVLLQKVSVQESVGCRLKRRPGNSNEAIPEEPQTVDYIPDEDLGLGENPTPMMIALKRKSMVATPKVSSVKKEDKKDESKAETPQRSRRVANAINNLLELKSDVPNTREVSPLEGRRTTGKIPRMTSPPVSRVASPRSPRFNASSSITPRSEFPGAEGCKIYLVNGDAKELLYEDVFRMAPDFEGANLTVLHTPVEWEPVSLLKFVLSIKRINQKAKLDSYLMLIGCGISNAKLVQDALSRQTHHVQFVVFERADQNKDNHEEGKKLREVTSFFLLAYFFPGCQNEGSEPPEPMVRPGFSNCFHTKSIEDLENNILYAFSEQGDWILDVYCRNREISLGAQKTGRNLIAFDPNQEMLFEVKEKALAVACHHDKTFRPEIDGRIQTL